jgi:hypothetical protein
MSRFTKDTLRAAAVWLAIWGACMAAALIKYGVPPA